jgi:hypothetical protein
MKNRCRTFILTALLFMASALSADNVTECWGRFEITLKHTTKSNPFDVRLSATFSNGKEKRTVSGFYDGDGTYKIRFMPTTTGKWKYTTSSSASSMNGKSGELTVTSASGGNHGMVTTDGEHNFKYADGTRYYPLGTTAYAWVHMKRQTQEQTLESLKESAFNKVRMCIFPKSYSLVKDIPEYYPFETKDGKAVVENGEKIEWDFTRFNPEYFRHIESRIEQLEDLGIEADVILFHPYDKGRWGFDSMSSDVNMRYIDYVVARLSSFRNVWWSMANEWDYVKSKTVDDWKALIKRVNQDDAYNHLLSIHGATATYFDYWMPEITHVSIQDEAPVISATSAATLRQIYHKPVLCDEVGYEGNLPFRWGRLSGRHMTNLIVNGLLGGIYVTHGECFQNNDEPIFWAQGGKLSGESWKRVKFLAGLLNELPNPLEMSDISRDLVTSTAGTGYYIVNMGDEPSDKWTFNLPVKNASYGRPAEGKRYKVDVIDVWEMTVTECPTIFEATAETDYRVFDKNHGVVRLPSAPNILLRIREVE